MRPGFHAIPFAFALALTSVLVTTANASVNAKTILRKAEQRYHRARTFEVTAQLIDLDKNTKKPVAAMTLRSAGQKTRMETSALPGAGSDQFRFLTILDGRNFIFYSPTANRYGEGKAPAAISFIDFLPSPSELAAGTYALLPSEKLNGRSVYVIVSIPKMSGEEPMRYYYIDKATYHLRQMKMAGKEVGSTLFAFRNERFNISIPASIFHFIPPKGVQKVKMADAGAAMSSGNPLSFMTLALLAMPAVVPRASVRVPAAIH